MTLPFLIVFISIVVTLTIYFIISKTAPKKKITNHKLKVYYKGDKISEKNIKI